MSARRGMLNAQGSAKSLEGSTTFAGPLSGLRVDVVTSSRELFGSDRSAVRLVAALHGMGAAARLVLPEHRPELGLTQLAESRGVSVAEAPFAVATSRGIENASSMVRNNWSSDADVTILNTTAVLLPRAAAGPRVVMVREWLSRRNQAHRALARLQARRAKYVVGVSSGVVEQWEQCTRSVPTTRIWNWLEPEWHQAEHHTGRDGRCGILLVGRFNAWKGQSVLADAYDQAFPGSGASTSAPPLTFVGAEEVERFARRARSISARAEHRPWTVATSVAHPRSLMNRAALIVVPSQHPEPFGNVVLEGLAAGCRVAAYSGGGPDDLDPLFPGSLNVLEREATALPDFLRNWWSLERGAPQSEADFARTRQTLSSTFSVERAQRQWLEVIDAVLNAPTGPRFTRR